MYSEYIATFHKGKISVLGNTYLGNLPYFDSYRFLIGLSSLGVKIVRSVLLTPSRSPHSLYLNYISVIC